jgi:uncharacterized membrane protein
VNVSWRTNLWLTPSLIVGGALAVFAVSQRLDWADYTGRLALPKWLDQGSAADARSLLSATAGAIITTLGLVLSITVLTLSIAASQFGQRLLRRYMRDRGTQVCIGIFAATFVFSLLTLLSVTSRANEREYVPWLCIWISTLGALTCIAVLIYYINHVANSIQVNNVLAQLSSDFRWVIHYSRWPKSPSATSIPEVHPSLALAADASGYIQSIDYEALAAAATEADAVLRFLFRPGEFIVEGATLAVAEIPELPGRQLQYAFAKAVRIGVRRTLRQDPDFAIAQIVEIALRAMSPALNDPNTAVACVNWLADALRVWAKFRPNPGYVDRQGDVRVIAKIYDFEQVVASVYDPLRHVSRNSPMLSIAMLNSIALIAPFVQASNSRAALHNQVELISAGLFADVVGSECEEVATSYRRAIEALNSSERTDLAETFEAER